MKEVHQPATSGPSYRSHRGIVYIIFFVSIPQKITNKSDGSNPYEKINENTPQPYNAKKIVKRYGWQYG
ncbi:hypothetical protein GCM10022398_01560 [Acetobacter lovaniensis]|nr:hypothetical protein AA0474_0922 [Acetobacter lovaniensis NRIC 0474]